MLSFMLISSKEMHAYKKSLFLRLLCIDYLHICQTLQSGGSKLFAEIKLKWNKMINFVLIKNLLRGDKQFA